MKKKEIKEGLFIIIFTFFVFGCLMLSNTQEQPVYLDEQEILSIAINEDVQNQEFVYNSVTVTKYNPVINQCDSDPLITADGSFIDTLKLGKGEIRWIAVSRDLRDTYHYGDTVYLSACDDSIDGYYVVRDTMNKRWKNRVDILSPCGDSLGKWENVYIYKK